MINSKWADKFYEPDSCLTRVTQVWKAGVNFPRDVYILFVSISRPALGPRIYPLGIKMVGAFCPSTHPIHCWCISTETTLPRVGYEEYVFLLVMLCNSEIVCPFGGICLFQLQGRRLSQQKRGPNCVALQPEDRTLHPYI
jgi:hypothetical protein